MIKELVEYVVKQIVSNPQDVSIIVDTTNDKHTMEIVVHEQDRGKIIGRDGQTIKAIRMLVNAVVADDKKISIDIAK